MTHAATRTVAKQRILGFTVVEWLGLGLIAAALGVGIHFLVKEIRKGRAKKFIDQAATDLNSPEGIGVQLYNIMEPGDWWDAWYTSSWEILLWVDEEAVLALAPRITDFKRVSDAYYKASQSRGKGRILLNDLAMALTDSDYNKFIQSLPANVENRPGLGAVWRGRNLPAPYAQKILRAPAGATGYARF